jgi:hypothetical protein
LVEQWSEAMCRQFNSGPRHRVSFLANTNRAPVLTAFSAPTNHCSGPTSSSSSRFAFGDAGEKYDVEARRRSSKGRTGGAF